MNILVCIKQVPDDAVAIRLNEQGQPALEGVTQVVNAFDTYALEMATRLKETCGEGSVTVLTAGDGEASVSAMRSCLSVGADHAAIVQGTACADVESAACLLAKAADKLSDKPFDIIFCGCESTDAANGQMPFYLAQQLDVPVVSNVLGLEMNGSELLVKQETEDGYRMVETSCPCVLSVVKPDYEPRYPSIKSKMAARKMPIATLTSAELGMDAGALDEKVRRTGLAVPAARQGGIKLQEKEAVTAVSRAVELLAAQKLL